MHEIWIHYESPLLLYVVFFTDNFFPLYTQAIFIFSLVKYTPPTYNETYVYPWWGYLIGWLMACSSMICPPLVICIQLLFNSQGSLREVGGIELSPSNITLDFLEEDARKYCHIMFQYFLVSSKKKKEIQYYLYYLDNRCEIVNSLSEQQQKNNYGTGVSNNYEPSVVHRSSFGSQWGNNRIWSGSNANVRISALVHRKWAWFWLRFAIMIVNKIHDVTITSKGA